MKLPRELPESQRIEKTEERENQMLTIRGGEHSKVNVLSFNLYYNSMEIFQNGPRSLAIRLYFTLSHTCLSH